MVGKPKLLEKELKYMICAMFEIFYTSSFPIDFFFNFEVLLRIELYRAQGFNKSYPETDIEETLIHKFMDLHTVVFIKYLIEYTSVLQ